MCIVFALLRDVDASGNIDGLGLACTLTRHERQGKRDSERCEDRRLLQKRYPAERVKMFAM